VCTDSWGGHKSGHLLRTKRLFLSARFHYVSSLPLTQSLKLKFDQALQRPFLEHQNPIGALFLSFNGCGKDGMIGVDGSAFG